MVWVSIDFDSHYQSTLDAVYVCVMPWSEFPIVPSYPHYPQVWIKTFFYSLAGVPREQKMLKVHLPKVIYHQVYLYTKRNGVVEDAPGALFLGETLQKAQYWQKLT